MKNSYIILLIGCIVGVAIGYLLFNTDCGIDQVLEENERLRNTSDSIQVLYDNSLLNIEDRDTIIQMLKDSIENTETTSYDTYEDETNRILNMPIDSTIRELSDWLNEVPYKINNRY